MTAGVAERWASGDLYEPYVGRWSRLVAREFLPWLDPPAEPAVRGDPVTLSARHQPPDTGSG